MTGTIIGHPTTKDPGSKQASPVLLLKAISEELGGEVLDLNCPPPKKKKWWKQNEFINGDEVTVCRYMDMEDLAFECVRI